MITEIVERVTRRYNATCAGYSIEVDNMGPKARLITLSALFAYPVDWLTMACIEHAIANECWSHFDELLADLDEPELADPKQYFVVVVSGVPDVRQN